MCSMAIRTHCGNDKPALEEALAVNTFSVALDDLVLCPRVTRSRFLSLAMASSAKIWNIRGKSHRSGIAFPKRAVLAMTLQTGGSVWIILGEELPVRAFLILFSDLRVTSGAIDFLRDGLARTDTRGRNACVALAAGCLHMAGMTEFLSVHKERTTIARGFQAGLIVAP